MIKKKVMIGDKEITFKMSAATPRIYRAQFKQDLLLALDDASDFETLENLAWVAAGCPGKSVEAWLETLPASASPEITMLMMDMWYGGNVATVEGAEKANEGDSKNAAKEEG